MATVKPSPPAGDNSTHAPHRYGVVSGVVVNTTLASCDILDVREYTEIAIKPSASITGLSVYAALATGDTFVLVDSIGTNGAVTVVAAKWNVLDVTKIKPFGYLRFVPNTNGTLEVVAKT